MTKKTFYLILGAAIALWLSGLPGLAGYFLMSVLFVVAGYAFDFTRHLLTGVKAGLSERKATPAKRPTLYVVK